MLFSSLSFLYFFLPVVVLLYFACRLPVWRNIVLLLASLFFYSWGDPQHLLLFVLSGLSAWLCGLAMEKLHGKARTLLLIAEISILTGLLVYFKYLGFFISIFSAELSLPQLALPAGISFYTFQLLSYLFDTYRRKTDCEKNLFRFMLYLSFFPQLIQGPILRYGEIAHELAERSIGLNDAVYGMQRFIIGLGKKVIIADNIALIASGVYAAPELSGTMALWLAAISYTLQLYFDFSGYCDMAIGLGRIFGFHLPENFNYPYAATSITDFWRRWHITLSQWFRDYIYIPLGGNRVSTVRFVVNILIVWGLTGLWHGASWNFIMWGLYYGILLLAEKLLLGERLGQLPMLLRRAATLFFVTLGWVLFNISDTQTLLGVLREMFVYSPTDWLGLLKLDTSICSKLVFLPIAMVFSFPLAQKFRLRSDSLLHCAAANLFCLGILAVSIMYIISSSFTPFIYFSF